MAKILLHIGPGKCGSTLIQDTLLHNSSYLNSLGLCYPIQHLPSRYQKKLRSSVPTSGNIIVPKSNNWPRQISKIVQGSKSSAFDGYLFSNEGLINRFFLFFFGNLNALLEKHDVTVVLTIRDVDEFLFSTYLQYVKTVGLSLNFAEYLDSVNYFPPAFGQVCEVVKHLRCLGVPVRLLNFSASKAFIARQFVHCLGEDMANLESLDSLSRNVNPSLNLREYLWHIAANRLSKKVSASSINFRFTGCNAALTPVFTLSQAKKIQLENKEFIQFINQSLCSEIKLRSYVRSEFIMPNDFDFHEADISTIQIGLQQFQGCLEKRPNYAEEFIRKFFDCFREQAKSR